jgi:hypothetical protein
MIDTMVFNTAAVAAAHILANKNSNEVLEAPISSDYHYYDLVIKKFFKFPIVKVATGKFPDVKIKTINSQTLWVSQHWLFHDEECQANPINYVNENLEKYLSFDVWDYLKEDVMRKYLDGVKADYDIALDESKLNYTTKVSWVVDRHTEKDRIEILSSYWS